MLFRIVAKSGKKEFEIGVHSITKETQMIRLREELETAHPGYKIYFYPEVKVENMYSTGSFQQLPIEKR